MGTRKLILGTLLAGSSLAIIRFALLKVAREKPALSASTFAAIDGYIDEQMRRLHIPGASLAVVEGDRIVHTRGYGRARPGGETPTPQTPFFIGSITKSITALGIMQLVETGKVELDVPVQHYLPWFRVADPVASATMTVRHLLNQTSGLPMMPSEIIQADFDTRPDAVERQVRGLATLKTIHPVGERCEYSNFNYNILGQIIETVSGETYAGYIQKHIFDPLEMRHSYASKSDAQKDGLAVGYRTWFSFPFPVPDWPVDMGSLPSGHLISCAEDMAHYLVAQLNGGKYANIQVLSRAGLDEMHRGVKELKLGPFSGGLYGMGWFDIDLGAEKTYSHGGNVPDFSAFMALIPGLNKAVILLMNSDPCGLPPITEELGLGVTALLAGQQPAPIKLDFIRWIMRLLPLIPVVQIAGAVTTLLMLRRWDRNPTLRPGSHKWSKHIVLPLIPSLSMAGILAYLQSSRTIRFLDLFMPDLAWIARVCGGFAAVWAVIRTGLVLKSMKKPRL